MNRIYLAALTFVLLTLFTVWAIVTNEKDWPWPVEEE